jgi:hypothetical protein
MNYDLKIELSQLRRVVEVTAGVSEPFLLTDECGTAIGCSGLKSWRDAFGRWRLANGLETSSATPPSNAIPPITKKCRDRCNILMPWLFGRSPSGLSIPFVCRLLGWRICESRRSSGNEAPAQNQTRYKGAITYSTTQQNERLTTIRRERGR